MGPTSMRDGAKVLENPQCPFCMDGLLPASRPRTNCRSGDTAVPSSVPSCSHPDRGYALTPILPLVASSQAAPAAR